MASRGGVLLNWIEDPTTERGVRFAASGERWEQWSWAELAAAANDAAARFSELAGGRGGVVAIVAPNSPEFIASFYGALLAGLTPCPLAPPKVIDDLARYQHQLGALLAIAEPVVVATVEECRATIAELVLHCPLVSLVACRDALPFSPAPTAALGLLQFTSGSSGRPRAVRVTRENLEANLRAIIDLVEIDPQHDEVVTWLPTYHDMGLIGCTLTPAATSVAMNMLRVEDFVLNPRRWLQCLGAGDQHANMTGTPPFGLGYAMKRIPDADLEGLDFSRWRVCLMGAERIDAGLLLRFIGRFRHRGLSPSVFVPAYGLAEGTLLVSAKRDAGVARAIRPDWSTVAFGKRVVVEACGTLEDHETIGDGSGWLVACGSCPEGIGVQVADENGEPQPDLVLGELVVRGPCVTDGYLGDPHTSAERFSEDRRLHTGDAGFLLDGQLYVIGRMANALKVHGRWLFVEDVELALLSSGIVERGRLVVFAGARATGDEVVVLVERQPGPWSDAIGALLRREVPEAVGVRVLSAARGSIERTSSGKPRRALLWARHLAGELQAETVFTGVAQQIPAGSAGAGEVRPSGPVRGSE